MKVVIVNVNKSRVQKNIEYHLYTIKTFIDARSYGSIDTEIVNVFMSDDMTTSVNLIENANAEIILFRALYWNISFILKLAQSCKPGGANRGLWGYDTFAHPEQYLRKDFDFIIQDEPELSLYEAAMLRQNGESIGSASGIVYKDDIQKSFVYGEARVLNDLDLIPSPYTNGLIEVNSGTSVYWEIARGCLFRCDFCVDFSHGGNLRYHSFDYLEKELKFFADRGVSQITIGAPIANSSHQIFRKILDMIVKYLPYASVEMQVRPDLLSRHDIETLAEMNVFLNIGLQSTSQKVHEGMMSSLNVANSINNIKYMANFPSLMFGIDIIAGLPKTTFDDFLKDLEVAFKLWPVSLSVLHLSMYPGTKIYNRICEFGYSVENGYPYLALESETFAKKDFEKVDEISDGIEVLYNKGRMVSIITMLADALEMPCSDIIMRWNKWIKKQPVEMNAENVNEIDYMQLFAYIHEFFEYLFDRFQKKKLWPLASDLLRHNHFYTTSLMTMEDDIISMPYEIDAVNDSSKFAVNNSVFFDKFSYDIEDVADNGYIDLKKYASAVDKEALCGLVYRIEGSVFTKVISDDEYAVFKYLRDKKGATLAELKSKFKKVDVLNIVCSWAIDGVIYIVQN